MIRYYFKESRDILFTAKRSVAASFIIYAFSSMVWLMFTITGILYFSLMEINYIHIIAFSVGEIFLILFYYSMGLKYKNRVYYSGKIKIGFKMTVKYILLDIIVKCKRFMTYALLLLPFLLTLALFAFCLKRGMSEAIFNLCICAEIVLLLASLLFSFIINLRFALCDYLFLQSGSIIRAQKMSAKRCDGKYYDLFCLKLFSLPLKVLSLICFVSPIIFPRLLLCHRLIINDFSQNKKRIRQQKSVVFYVGV